MVRLGAPDLQALADVLRAAESAPDREHFGEAIVPALRRLIDCDVLGYNELDFARSEAGLSLAWPLDVVDRADHAALDRLLGEHPIARYVTTTGDGGAVQIDDFVSPAQFHRLELYTDYYRPLDIEHLMAITLDTHANAQIAPAFGRSRGVFGERDRWVLDLLRPHLALAYLRADARGRARDIATRRVTPGERHGVVTLDERGRPVAFIGHARRWLK